MNKMISEGLRRFLSEDAGATATEYAIMLVLILLVSLATIYFLGQQVEVAFNTFTTLLSGAGS